MKIKFLLSAVASLALAGTSQAALIAGWDFSQYAVPGFVSLDGETLSNTLVANHSDLDPTNRSGIESNAFGTMHIDGQFGSFNTPLDFTDPFNPIDLPPAGSLTSNASQAFLGFGSPAACVQGQVENMPNANCTNVAMNALAEVSVVFEAIPSAGNALRFGENWGVQFAGRSVVAGTNSTISVEFSPDGITYALFGTANLTPVDTAYSFNLGTALSPRGYVRLTFNGASEAGGIVPAIDNLGIRADLRIVPEPSTAILVGAGLIGLVRAGRRRA